MEAVEEMVAKARKAERAGWPAASEATGHAATTVASGLMSCFPILHSDKIIINNL